MLESETHNTAYTVSLSIILLVHIAAIAYLAGFDFSTFTFNPLTIPTP